jgi:hypothetical protein
MGSEPGAYEIKLLRTRSDETPLIQATGTARIEDGLTVLLISVNCSHVEAGTYVVAFRPKSGSWRYSNVTLS